METKETGSRPWGGYEVLQDEPCCKVKKITVHPCHRLSLQRHQRRSEHWFVVRGVATVACGNEILQVPAGRSVDIPCGVKHRVANTGSDEDLVFIEIQTGEYFGEDDIERLEDDYGRA